MDHARGDLIFNGGTPFVLMGSVAGAIEALQQVIVPLGARTIVPGHGPVFSGTEPIERTADYLRFVQQTAADGQAAGQSPLEAARAADLGPFAHWTDAERIAGNLHRASLWPVIHRPSSPRPAAVSTGLMPPVKGWPARVA